jgi:hypothetical protein
MFNSKTKYNIKKGINKYNDAYVLSEIKYKDAFSFDKYELLGFVINEELKFSVKRNDLYLGEFFHSFDFDVFLENLIKITKDYDFVEDFKKNHIKNYLQEINSYVEKINSSIIVEGKIIDNYKNKLQIVAGIKKMKYE